jgi:DNA-binding transcriptional LysR family regulator
MSQLESSVCIGGIYKADDAVVRVTQPRLPCWKLARRFQLKDMAVRLRSVSRTPTPAAGGWRMRIITRRLPRPGGNQVETLAQLKTLVEAGAGIGMVPPRAAAAESRAGLLHLLAMTPLTQMGIGYA